MRLLKPALGLLTPLVLAPAGVALGDEVACAGPLGPQSSEAQLIEAFGAENVVTGELPGPEGSTLVGTTVFPDDPERSFLVYWWDEESRTGISSFSVPAKDTGPMGLRVGMTIAEVEALNGGPFAISGFSWDYGGYANLGETSPLQPLPGGCFASLRFAPTKDAPEGTNVDAVQGDVQVPTTEPLLAVLEPRVEQFWLNYAYPEDASAPAEGETE